MVVPHELDRCKAVRSRSPGFNDFDLLFGAAKLNLKIVEIPIRYRQRTYGTTNISRFTYGWLLLRMSIAAARRLFFIP